MASFRNRIFSAAASGLLLITPVAASSPALADSNIPPQCQAAKSPVQCAKNYWKDVIRKSDKIIRDTEAAIRADEARGEAADARSAAADATTAKARAISDAAKAATKSALEIKACWNYVTDGKMPNGKRFTPDEVLAQANGALDDANVCAIATGKFGFIMPGQRAAREMPTL